jgi:hypothetical protein
VRHHGFCGDSPLVAHRTEFVSLTTEMNAPQLALRRVFQMTIAVQPVLWHILIPEDDIMVVKTIGFKVVDSSVTAWAEGLRGSHSPIVAK